MKKEKYWKENKNRERNKQKQRDVNEKEKIKIFTTEEIKPTKTWKRKNIERKIKIEKETNKNKGTWMKKKK
jgi:hypothetical protein